ncbi:MAG: hypothetical protein F9K39_01875 [Exiguobacterium chiriqhucha]|uniref:hypothetical protein n=1 Tax=Exiguobacterium chiriqhucha TaxID=1385984 RepID=UPI00144EDB9D|nr:hypothetical protein [Exiguobacterium chiriqhucha]KAB2865409.1 MAG: hypothetical protein F9K39_01875 [Exiguobacterium chiriqhucha]
MPQLEFLTHTRYQGERFRKGDIVELSEKDVKFLVANGLAITHFTFEEVAVVEPGTDGSDDKDALDVTATEKLIDEEWKLDELKEDMEAVGIIGIDKTLKKSDLIKAIVESGQAEKLLAMLEDETE